MNINMSGSGKLKIILIADWYLPRLGGTEMHLHDLALRLARAGHDAQIITSTPGADETDGIRTHRLDAPLFPGTGLVWTRRAFTQIKSILQNEACDVVHCHGNVVNPVAYGGLYISQNLGIPAIITWKSILGVYTPLMKMMDRPIFFNIFLMLSFSTNSAMVFIPITLPISLIDFTMARSIGSSTMSLTNMPSIFR